MKSKIILLINREIFEAHLKYEEAKRHHDLTKVLVWTEVRRVLQKILKRFRMRFNSMKMRADKFEKVIFMNYEFIEALLELYKEIPEDSSDMAAVRVAVLVEMEMRAMETSGEKITRETMIQKIRLAIRQHRDTPAA